MIGSRISVRTVASLNGGTGHDPGWAVRQIILELDLEEISTTRVRGAIYLEHEHLLRL